MRCWTSAGDWLSRMIRRMGARVPRKACARGAAASRAIASLAASAISARR